MWQCRGCLSFFGAVFIITYDTGKGKIFCEAKFCKGCRHLEKQNNAYSRWKYTHVRM